VDWRAVVAVILLVGGGALELLAVLGLCVMRSVYDRLHYVGLAGFGALMIAVAVVVRESFSLIGDKALLTGAVLVVFGPVLVHTTARSLRIREHGDWRHESGEGRARESALDLQRRIAARHRQVGNQLPERVPAAPGRQGLAGRGGLMGLGRHASPHGSAWSPRHRRGEGCNRGDMLALTAI
jgi:multisubunit Na+/H+ antiporter MnhG subunit